MPRRKKPWYRALSLKRLRLGINAIFVNLSMEWKHDPPAKRRVPTKRQVARQVQRLYEDALPAPAAGTKSSSTAIVPVRVSNTEILTPTEYSARFLVNRPRATAADVILDTITEEGLRTFKKSLRKGDYATAAAAAIVSLVAEDIRRNRPSN